MPYQINRLVVWNETTSLSYCLFPTPSSPGVHCSGDEDFAGRKKGVPNIHSNAEKCTLFWLLKFSIFWGLYFKSSTISFPSNRHIMRKIVNVKLLCHYHTDKIEHYDIFGHLAFSARRFICLEQGDFLISLIGYRFFFLNHYSLKNWII